MSVRPYVCMSVCPMLVSYLSTYLSTRGKDIYEHGSLLASIRSNFRRNFELLVDRWDYTYLCLLCQVSGLLKIVKNRQNHPSERGKKNKRVSDWKRKQLKINLAIFSCMRQEGNRLIRAATSNWKIENLPLCIPCAMLKLAKEAPHP